MTHAADEFRRCLVNLDIDGVVRIWRAVQPNLPVPPTREEVLAAIHMARAGAGPIPAAMRVYSHAWLCDHNLPSPLPDHLKPLAERLYPRIAKSVGISVVSKYPAVQKAILGAMTEAVLEAYADGHQDDPERVRARMQEARRREQKGLGLL